MKIIKNSDIKFRINKKLVYLPNFTIRFYTVNQKEYFLEKTQDDLVEYQREATVDDVDVILSGGTTVTEYYLPLNWNQLMFVGKGVLNYKLTNNIEDPEFPDYQFNKEEIVTTDFYIDSLEVDPEPEEGLIERIVLLEEHLAEEIVNREQADTIITENLNAEEARAISAETALDEKIDAEETRASGEEQRIEGKLDQEIADRQTDVNAEEARAISAETALDAKIDKEIQDRKDDVDAEETRAINAESALTDTINAEANRAISAETELSNAITNETNRATSAETTLDEKIVAETNRATSAETALNEALQAETNRATSAEAALDTKLDQEIADRIADVNAEEARAISAETVLQEAIDAEETRATTAENELDTKIGAETTRATGAENALDNKIDAETTRATGVEAAIDAKIDTVSGNVISETTRATTAENALSGAIDSLDVRFFDDAKYEDSGNTKVINFYNGNVVKATIDASDFIVDGMVEDVRIENGYLVIDFNTASGKQDISIPLTDIFDPSNYYTKSETSGATEIATALAQKLNISDFNTYSGSVDTRLAEDEEVTSRALNALNEAVSGKLNTADFNTYSGTVDTALNNKADTSAVTAVQDSLSGYVYTADLGKQDIFGSKTFIGAKKIQFTQAKSSDKLGFTLYDARDEQGNAKEFAAFELNPTGITENSVTHPLLTLNHYRNDSGRDVQTYIGYRQYDQPHSAAYHLLAPLPENAKTPFNLSTTFQNYYFPLGFKNGSTMIKADNTGVVNLSSEFGGKVDTSAITTSVTSSSTDSQVPSAKAVYNIVGNIETLLSQI